MKLATVALALLVGVEALAAAPSSAPGAGSSTPSSAPSTANDSPSSAPATAGGTPSSAPATGGTQTPGGVDIQGAGAAGAGAAQDRFWSHLKDNPLGPLRLDFGGQVRLRYEHDDQFSVKGYAPDTHDQFLLERVMLEATLRYGPRGRVFLQLRDAHVFGTRLGEADFTGNNPFTDHLDIRQAFAEWLRIGGSPLGVKVGRQQISYGDQRVFGPGQWGNTGRWYWDVGMLTLDTNYLALDVWAGRPVRSRPEKWPDRPAPDPTAVVAYARVKRLPLRLDVFYALKYNGKGDTPGERGAGDLVSSSVGLQAAGLWRRLDYSGTFVAQLGAYGQDTLRAFGASGTLGVTLPLPWQPRLAALVTWGSGDRNPTDGVHGTFDGVFGGADIMFYGYLNLFMWANLRDYEANLHLQPARTLRVHVQYHYFTIDAARDAWYSTSLKAVRQDATGAAGIALGHELDARVIWTLWGRLELMAGYGRFFPGTFVATTGPAPAANWFFGQTSYSF